MLGNSQMSLLIGDHDTTTICMLSRVRAWKKFNTALRKTVKTFVVAS